LVCSLVLLFLAGAASAQGVPLKSGAGSDLATVDTAKNLRVALGAPTRATYTCSAGGLATTAAYALSLESEVSRGFKIARICVGTSVATAAALQTVTVKRETAASSGGTAVTAEGTGTSSVAQHVPGTGNWGGVCRITGTAGTAGALLDTWGMTVGELGAGAADPGSPPVFCKTYGVAGEQMPTVASGTANGVDVRVTAAGAGGLASGSIAITFIAE
jgi:hypothetical protein